MIVQLLKCLFRLLLLDPLIWMYHTSSRLIRCCNNVSSQEACYNKHSSSKSTYYLQGDLVVHERQFLQLCAVHTINNLLQLTHDHAYSDLTWCCGNFRWRAERLEPASQKEMDAIACDLTRAEDALLQRRHQPWHQRCCYTNSNHRTPYYGNYSFETLEVSLKNRNVSLEWFQVNNMNNVSDACDGPVKNALLDVPPTSSSINSNVNNESSSIVVGFIINSIECADSPCGCGEHTLPVLRKCCEDVERHWFAISRVRRRVNDYAYGGTASNTAAANNIEAPEEDRWKILDSDRLGEATVLREDQLRDYLQQLATQDATIFRAILKVKRYE